MTSSLSRLTQRTLSGRRGRREREGRKARASVGAGVERMRQGGRKAVQTKEIALLFPSQSLWVSKEGLVYLWWLWKEELRRQVTLRLWTRV